MVGSTNSTRRTQGRGGEWGGDGPPLPDGRPGIEARRTAVAMSRTSHPGRRGFTLVELLVVIAIIGLIISLILVAAADGVRRAEERATQALITKLNDGVTDRLDALLNANAPINQTHRYLAAITYSTSNGLHPRRHRLQQLRRPQGPGHRPEGLPPGRAARRLLPDLAGLGRRRPGGLLPDQLRRGSLPGRVERGRRLPAPPRQPQPRAPPGEQQRDRHPGHHRAGHADHRDVRRLLRRRQRDLQADRLRQDRL